MFMPISNYSIPLEHCELERKEGSILKLKEKFNLDKFGEKRTAGSLVDTFIEKKFKIKFPRSSATSDARRDFLQLNVDFHEAISQFDAVIE